MLELIGRIIVWLFAKILIEWILGGILRFVYGVGLRAYSLFTGGWELSLKAHCGKSTLSPCACTCWEV